MTLETRKSYLTVVMLVPDWIARDGIQAIPIGPGRLLA